MKSIRGFCSIYHYFKIDLKRQKGLKHYKPAEQKVLDYLPLRKGAGFILKRNEIM